MSTAGNVAPTRAEPPNFDRVAALYLWAEYLALGPLLNSVREQFLPEFCDVRSALVLGDGDGRFAAALLRGAPRLQLCAVDGSAAMLALLRRRCVRQMTADRLRTEHGSVLDAQPPPECTLIATHFLLDCLAQTEVELLTSRLARQVSPGCRWVISEFGLPRGRFGRWAAILYIRALYLAFRALTGLRTQQLPDPQGALGRAGFTRLRRVERLGGFLYSELWELRRG